MAPLRGLPAEVSKAVIEGHSSVLQLCKRSGLNAYVGILDGEAALCVDACNAGSSRQLVGIGQRQPLYCSGLGKALLMGTADEELAWIVHTLLFAPRTPWTIAGPDALLLEIAASRRRGWAFDNRELYPTVLSIAAPAPKSSRLPLAAIGVSWETSSPPVDPDHIGFLVAETARALSCKISQDH
jgi:DNA-binding IclR family transcriptional regulator